jgi:hypothetical protein
MTDLVITQDGKAHQVIPGATKAEYCYRVHEGESEPRAIFPQVVIDTMVEVESGTVGEGWSFSDGTFTPPEVAPVNLSDYAGRIRFEKETGGVVIGGMAIATDRASQAMLTGAVLRAQMDANVTVKWKTVAGFVELSAPQIIAIGTAVGDHVEACFAKEADVAAGIAIGTITATGQIDAAFAEV